MVALDACGRLPTLRERGIVKKESTVTVRNGAIELYGYTYRPFMIQLYSYNYLPASRLEQGMLSHSPNFKPNQIHMMQDVHYLDDCTFLADVSPWEFFSVQTSEISYPVNSYFRHNKHETVDLEMVRYDKPKDWEDKFPKMIFEYVSTRERYEDFYSSGLIPASSSKKPYELLEGVVLPILRLSDKISGPKLNKRKRYVWRKYKTLHLRNLSEWIREDQYYAYLFQHI